MLKQLIYELFRGFAYRGISHDNMRIYTVWLPLLITVAAAALYVGIPVKPALIGPSGLIGSLLALISTLPGFYFAGLAAVATFGNATMDKEMPAPAPEVKMLVNGQRLSVKLTRRLFLSYLFSYLVILSLALCLALITINALAPAIDAFRISLVSHGGEWPWRLLKGTVGAAITFVFASMVVSTLHGIFFLTEKIHQP